MIKDIYIEKLCEKFGNNIKNLSSIDPEYRMRELAKFLDYEYEQTILIVSEISEVNFIKKFAIDDGILGKFPVKLIIEYKLLPINVTNDKICVIACWPLNSDIIQWINISTGYTVEFCLGAPEDIVKVINERFGLGDTPTPASIDQINDMNEDEDAIVIKFVNELIKRCIFERATDIHFEPQRTSLEIRYRVDGDLIIARVPANLKNFQSAIISRLKIMARLNISEKRRPQDGKIAFKTGNETIDIRVSTLPVAHGESVSLRLLTNVNSPTSICDIGLDNFNITLLKRSLSYPHGLILVTGPTGSGKSTTLSACLREIRVPNKRLMTVEDPIEYEVPGVNQTQVYPEIGLTFANILRSILRQDPDVIMIGEIRDRETADIAIRASITGHLVLSTLHTNDSIGAITRLRDIGVKEFLLASALRLIIAQRLVRKLCPHCAIKEDFRETSFEDASRIFQCPELKNALMAKGCEHCNGTGFKGRIGIFEILNIDNDIHDAIASELNESEIKKIALSRGMISLEADLLKKITFGFTSINEALRIIEH